MPRKKARRVGPHAAISRKCKTCGVAHSKSVHKSHGYGAFKRTHKEAPTAQRVFERLVDQSTDARLAGMVQELESGVTHDVGRLIVTDDGEVLGRLRGGFLKQYPEFRHFEQTPGRVLKSLKSKRTTPLKRRIYEVARSEVAEEQRDEILAFMESDPVAAIEAAGFRVPGVAA